MTQSDPPNDPKNDKPADTPVAPTPAGEQLVLNSPDEARSLKDFALWAGVILLVALTVYAPALRGSFIWDDDKYVANNHGLENADGLANIWTGHLKYIFASPAERAEMRVFTPQYYPMTHTSYWLEYQFSDAKPGEINTTVFHVDNVILHVIGAILFWLVLRELLVPGAWVAAAIWALHPVQTESVAWISERKNVLAGVFFFGAMLAYVKWSLKSDDRPEAAKDWTLPLTAVALFTLAVLSKTVACSLPAVLLLIVWWKRGTIPKRDLLVTLPMFAIGIALGLVTAWTERNFVHAEGPEYALSFVQRMLIAGNAVWFYVIKLLLPVRLTFIYPRWDINPARPELWLGPIALVAVLGLLFALRTKLGRGPLVAALIFVGVMLPALGFVNFYPMRYSFVADHFQYLASASLITLLVAMGAALIRRLTAGAPREAPFALAGVLLIALAILTARQASVYASSIDLWRDTAGKNPDSWMAHNNYGTALLNVAGDLPPERADDRPGMLDQSMKEFARAVEIKPDHERAWNNWGQALLLRGKPEDAMPKLSRALELNPNNVEALMGLGRAQFVLKQTDAALATYARALEAARAQRATTPKERAAAIYHALGLIAQAKGDLPLAIQHLAKATSIVPEMAEYRYDLAGALAQGGKLPSAAEEYARAIRLQPDFIDARIGLAKLMMKVENARGAQEQLIAAARINANYPPLMDAAKQFDALVKRLEATTQPSTTQPSTTQSTTNPATTRDLTSEIFTAPTTRPSK
jgi:tetratricopeptide (TPR) repeat protein